jgi:adenylate cyclase
VLASARTLSLVASPVTTGREFEIHPKGVGEPLRVFEVMGIGGPHTLAVPDRTVPVAPLDMPVDISVEVLQGKAAGGGFRSAQLTAVSTSSATIRSAGAMEVFDNLRVRLPADDGEFADVFAKVMAHGDDGTFSIRFTSLPPEAQEWVDDVTQRVGRSL